MRIHHLNCISSCPLGGQLMDGISPTVLQRGHLVCHCLLVEGNDCLILIDTGYGLNDVWDPESRLSAFFLKQLKPDFREGMTAIRQIEKMGFNPRDVRHILLSHLDFDHAGGLDDFPWAAVHMLEVEKTYAEKQKTWLDRQRFRPQQWSTKSNWVLYQGGEGESWFGFNQVHALEGLPPDIVMVPLVGHTFGHAGIAVRQEDSWLFYTGDAYFYHKEMDPFEPECTPGLRLYQTMMEKDKKSRLWNQERLRDLVRHRSDEVQVFCAHDTVEFERLAGRSADEPAVMPEKVSSQDNAPGITVDPREH